MSNEFPFSDRFNLLDIKLNKILDKLHDLSLEYLNSHRPFLDLQEAANYLNVSKYSLYSRTCRKEIPFFKPGRKIYFRVDELNQWVLSKENKIRTNEEIKSLAATKIMTDIFNRK